MSADTSTSSAASEPAAPSPERLGGDYFKLLGASTVSNLGDGIGLIAYPWLASAVTRNPMLIALVGVVQRLPWLLFSLPAGVITDRCDRRRLMIWSNVARAVITTGVAFVVLARQSDLPGPDAVDRLDAAASTDIALYLIVLAATMLLGVAEVLYDNTAQTFMPTIVHTAQLEKANGRLWSVEQVANTFAGPPLAALLLAVAFALPFFVDAATFAVSAVLIATIRPIARRHRAGDRPTTGRQPWRRELADGFRWLWRHDLLRHLAITLGLLNMLGTMSIATLVLFGQEVLETSPTEFAVLSTGGAIGGIVGGWMASSISRRIGPGASLSLTLVGGGVGTFVIGLMTWWPAVWLLFAFLMLTAVLWNVITVSLRQAIIPDHLLGRVNSVYRFFGWGMMPVGALLGGLIVAVTEPLASRELALQMPWFVAGGASVVLWFWAGPRLTTEKIERARAAASDG